MTGCKEISGDCGALNEALARVSCPIHVMTRDGALEFVTSGWEGLNGNPVAAYVAPYRLEDLGDAGFREEHGLRYAYCAGAMANGIASTRLIKALSNKGMLGFFGSGGLSLPDVEAAVDELTQLDGPFGFNLIHSPSDPELEAAVVDLYLRRGIHLVEAAAYLDLTLPVVRYRVHEIHRDESGAIVTPNRVIAKVSRIEVATKFFAPPPESFLRTLVEEGDITEDQAQLASQVPMARDITAEADSGGHTDNRSPFTLFPTMLALRDAKQAEHGYVQSLRVGLGGGISTPASAAAAFAMGAAYVVTGTVNQACVESGTCDAVREMLAETRQADVAMAAAADMFEMGGRVQVLKRGTMFPMRAAKLFELYRAYGSIEELPATERVKLEKTVFKAPLEEIWDETRAFFMKRDPKQVTRAEQDPKHKLALVFRWYLGQASHWANRGEPTRKIDYQVWCGPAMGAFNEWVRGSFLETPEAREVVTIAMNILYGAAVLSRCNVLRNQGLALDADAANVRPRPLDELEEYLS